MRWDVIIVGAGPAGSVCAATCSRHGLKTLLLDRSIFPRDKVCGDCINPAIWKVIDRLGWRENINTLPSRTPESVEFVSMTGRSFVTPMTFSGDPENVIRRRDLDQSLVECAIQNGTKFIDNAVVQKIDDGWQISVGTDIHHGKVLIAADGRNSSVCRLLGLLANITSDRVALQAHIPRPASLNHRIRMTLHKHGYIGLADMSDDLANLCIVAKPQKIALARTQIEQNLELPKDTTWRSITPLSRRRISSKLERLFVIGDAARVVEPFTGEGIFYAMRSGEIATQSIISGFHDENWKAATTKYNMEHSALYSKR
ncbi:MAG: NAD(P)/FAD-dependent oxidoreductase, partial [Chthoniobacterales bacterium]